MSYVQPPLPGMPPPVVELDDYAASVAARLKKARQAAKDWKAVEDECREILIKLLTANTEEEGTYTGLFASRVVAVANVHSTRRFDSKMFQSDHPQLYESYRRESIVTTVNVTNAADGDQ